LLIFSKFFLCNGSNILRIALSDEQVYAKCCCEIARYHHERYDGNGYPDGLRGDEIPIGAQIVSLADVFDALTSKRCYKEPIEPDKALKMIYNGECGAFNPKLLDCLKKAETAILTGKAKE
jgi:putative two-component system response regulator